MLTGYVWEPESPLEDKDPIPGPSKIQKLESSVVKEGESSTQNTKEAESPDKDDLRQKRLAYLSKIEKQCDNKSDKDTVNSNNETQGQDTPQCLINHKPIDEKVSETGKMEPLGMNLKI